MAAFLDLGDISVVSVDYFKSVALPPLCEPIDVSKVKDSLQRNPTIWMRDAGRWPAFKNKVWGSSKSGEKAFKPLSNVFDAVIREASKASGTPAKLRFASRPLASPLSEQCNVIFPDAYLLLVDKRSVDAQGDKKKHTDSDSWDDIVVSFGCKNNEEDAEREDHDKRIVWSLLHITGSDPCRRATFGITTEDTQMKFWFTCRAATLVSKPFDFFKEPEHLIYFFCCLAFADAHELGWDPTIQRVCVGGKIQYDITVCTDEGKNPVYQTTKVISDYRANALRGHGTRVFEARLKSEDGKLVKDAEPVVLKDSWHDCDGDREDRIHEQIFADLRKKQGIEQEAEARKYFLTVLAAGNVMVDGKIDGTDSLLRMSDLPADCTSYPLLVDEFPKTKPTRPAEGLIPSLPYVSSPAKRPMVVHRTHSRLVFKEVYQPIFEVRSLDVVFETLQDARQALQFMHNVDWVHREVNATNVLRAGSMGKLADLDYAKRMDSNSIHCEFQMEAPEFVACEVEVQKYLFISPSRWSLDRHFRPPFRFTPLHDMESLVWIPTWTLYYHVDQERSRPSEDHIRWFHTLFPGQPSRFGAFFGSFDYSVLPPSFHRAAHEVYEMHQGLMIAYTESEQVMPPAQEPDYTEPLAQLHSIFREFLASAVEYSRGICLFRPMAKCQQQENPTHETREKKKPKG
ncbi:hypothetical protein BKA83DRAFT_211114 [Pisolithus microcarpus]|nr:hypothetical protein BKA83DRAFT_211114 [Pisolithus microcarpus]